MQIKKYGIIAALIAVMGCGRAKETPEVALNREVLYAYTQNKEAIFNIFPKTVGQLHAKAEEIIDQARQAAQAIIAIPDAQRTFENTARALDTATFKFAIPFAGIGTLVYVSPDTVLQDAASAAEVKMSQAAVEIFGQNKELYKAFKAYYDGAYKAETLQPFEHYFVEETMKDFKRSGFDLPDDQRQEVIRLEKELSELTTKFENTINTDASSIIATKEELAGVDQSVIDNLKKTDDGNYIVGVDYPTYFAVMRYGTNENTRKRLYKTMENKAVPANITLLHEIIQKRDRLAKLLGYASYAQFNLENQMAKSPEAAEAFVCSVVQKAQAKVDREYHLLKSDLAPSVTLSPEGKMYPWNGSFARTWYKKKHFDLDERAISEYFPTGPTVERLLQVYERFFDVNMKQEQINNLWIEDLTLVTVYTKEGNTVLGYLILDLYPRPNKYSHACHIGIAPALRTQDGKRIPSFSVIVANLPKPSADKPALLMRSDAKTFFHEFGHAMHAILGATDLASQSGTHVKRDFVEMPSQMLEEWFYDKDVLTFITGHYKTGKPLDDTVIDTLIALKNFDAGTQLVGQASHALFALKCFCAGGCADTDALHKNLHDQLSKYTEYDPETHFQASFGHLMGYGARYYGYLWSQVFALDLFEYIKQFGLMNPAIGTVYAQKVLGKGGSQHPMELLKDFLGREPNDEAFVKDMGI